MDESIVNSVVEKQIELNRLVSVSTINALDGKYSANSDFFQALRDIFRVSLEFTLRAIRLENNYLKEEDIHTIMTGYVAKESLFMPLGATREETFVLCIKRAESLLIEAMIAFKKPSAIKKFLSMDALLRKQFSKSMKNLSECFQIYANMCVELDMPLDKLLTKGDL